MLWGLSTIPTSIFPALVIFTGPTNGIIHSSPFINLSYQMCLAGGMLLYAGLIKFKNYKSYDPLIYKYEMSKLMRNIGIITLGTSIVPLISTIPYFFMITYVPAFIILGANLSFFINQIVLGIILLYCGQFRLDYWKDIISSFEISMIYNDINKNFNEYCVQIGGKIRLL